METDARLDYAALGELHARGREIWPDVPFDLAAFSLLAAPRLGEGPLDELRPGDLFLATACVARVAPAMAALDRHYLRDIASVLARRGNDAAAVADAMQAVRVRFLVGEAGRAPRIAEYNGRGSLATWIQVAATRIAISARRKHHRETADEVELIAAERGPELELWKRQFGAELETAFRAAFEALSARERTLLRYQVIDRLGIDRIAAIYAIHRATAARWVARAREALADGVRRALQARFRVGGDELDSLVRALHSTLEISLRLLLTPG